MRPETRIIGSSAVSPSDRQPLLFGSQHLWLTPRRMDLPHAVMWLPVPPHRDCPVVRQFSVTVRTTFSETPFCKSAEIPSVTFTSAPTSPARCEVTSSAIRPASCSFACLIWCVVNSNAPLSASVTIDSRARYRRTASSKSCRRIWSIAKKTSVFWKSRGVLPRIASMAFAAVSAASSAPCCRRDLRPAPQAGRRYRHQFPGRIEGMGERG